MLKKIALWIALIALVPQLANAASAKLTTNASSCPNATNATALVVYFGNTYRGGISLTLSGTWTGTVSFKATGDGGTTWSTMTATPTGSSTDVTSATANGTWQRNISGLVGVCMLSSASMTGTAIATITLSDAPFASKGTGTGSGDTITSPNGTLVVGGTALATTLDALGAAGKIMAGATPALTFTPVLGVAGTSAGTLGVANGSGGGATTTFASAATTNNTINGPAIVIPDQTYVGCSTTSTTCTLTPLGTMSTDSTVWTATASTGFIGSPVTLVASQGSSKHVRVAWNFGVSTKGNCDTSSGVFQLNAGYKNALTGDTITLASNPLKISTTNGSGTNSTTISIPLPAGTPRDFISSGSTEFYMASGVALTYQLNQTTASTTCTVFPVVTSAHIVTVLPN